MGVWGIFDGGVLMGILCGRRWREGGGVGQHLLLSFDRRKGGGAMCMCLTDLRALLTTCSFMVDSHVNQMPRNWLTNMVSIRSNIQFLNSVRTCRLSNANANVSQPPHTSSIIIHSHLTHIQTIPPSLPTPHPTTPHP